MKVIKKTPLRARGRSDEKRQSTKDAIRDAYTNGPQTGWLKAVPFFLYNGAVQKQKDRLCFFSKRLLTNTKSCDTLKLQQPRGE